MLPRIDLAGCKVHFMRNILAHIPQRQKKVFASELKMIWLAPTEEIARERADALIQKYEKRFPKAIESWKTAWMSL